MGPTRDEITQLAEEKARVSCRARPDRPKATAPIEVMARAEPAKPRMTSPDKYKSIFGAVAETMAPAHRIKVMTRSRRGSWYRCNRTAPKGSPSMATMDDTPVIKP